MPLCELFETERMRAERLRPDHFAAMHALHQDPRVAATLSADGQPLPAEQTRAIVERNVAHWERHGFGLWMFSDRASGAFVGRGGLKFASVEGVEAVELAYAVAADAWGRGLAGEMARASLRAGFEQLGLAEIVGFTLTTNRASRRVMEKAGLRYERPIIHAGLPHVLYRLGAAEWRRSGEGDRSPGV